jgi:hypothetical protein
LTLTAGTSYAVAFICYNTGGAFGTPSISGPVAASGLQLQAPYYIGSLSGQTELPTSSTMAIGVSLGGFARLT